MIVNYLLVPLLLIGFAVPAAGSDKKEREQTIVAGSGWGRVQIGATKSQVAGALGEGQILAKYSNVYFMDYPEKGLQVGFLTKDNTVDAIFFYNKQKGSEYFSTFKGKTSTGIDWNSTAQNVIEAYGKPVEKYRGRDGFVFVAAISLQWHRLPI